MTNKQNPEIVRCLFGHHDFSIKFTTYKHTYLCAHCKCKTKTTFNNPPEIIYGDVVEDYKLVHIKYATSGNERWLSNGTVFYDKKHDCIRCKKQYWLRFKPKNWIYEGKLKFTN